MGRKREDWPESPAMFKVAVIAVLVMSAAIVALCGWAAIALVSWVTSK